MSEESIFSGFQHQKNKKIYECKGKKCGRYHFIFYKDNSVNNFGQLFIPFCIFLAYSYSPSMLEYILPEGSILLLMYERLLRPLDDSTLTADYVGNKILIIHLLSRLGNIPLSCANN